MAVKITLDKAALDRIADLFKRAGDAADAVGKAADVVSRAAGSAQGTSAAHVSGSWRRPHRF